MPGPSFRAAPRSRHHAGFDGRFKLGHNARVSLSRLLFGPSKHDLDPAWVPSIERRYDVKGGYRAYHEFCRRSSPSGSVDETADITRTGRDHLRVMTEEEAGEIERTVLERFTAQPGAEKSAHLSLFDIDDRAFERDLLERLLTEDVGRRASAFFGSEYFVYWYHVTRSVPVPEQGLNSFRWHCDRGPRGHLKLLFYLNDASVHGGGTAFLDLETTRKLEASGYVYAPVKTRLEDLGPIARESGVDYAPWLPEMKAGEGILFQPASVLHKGRLSTRGARHVVTICLLPSPIPWRAALERDVITRKTTDGKWHERASHFRDELSPP